MASRHLSIPMSTPPPTIPSDQPSHAVLFPPTPQQSQPQSQSSQGSVTNSHLIAQADALARMTFELNIRSVGAQANRLEKDLQQLVLRTVQDEEFREKHEHRLNEIWREILAVKTRMAEVHDNQQHFQTVAEAREKLVADMLRQYEKEMGELRDMFGAVSQQLDQMQAPQAILDNTPGAHLSAARLTNNSPPSAQPERQGVETRAMAKQRKSHIVPATTDRTRQNSSSNMEVPAHIVDEILKRIQETLNSTRRWNRDHKTTTVDDGTFVANYLKQQSKRDPSMAVFIQKSIRRRIRHRQPRGSAPPRSLEEFCRHVHWQDVTETVEAVLVRGEADAIQALR